MDDFCPVIGEPTCHCSGDMNPVLIPRHRDTLRKLFTDHAVYTKMFIVAFLDTRPEANVLQTRLLANQPEIGTYFGVFLGQDNGVAIGDLFTEHIKLAAGVLKALKTGGDVKKAIELVFVNVDKVSTALSELSNGYLSYEKIYGEFGKHNEFVVEIAKLHFNGQFQEEIEAYDEYYSHMLYFSDLLCDGLLH